MERREKVSFLTLEKSYYFKPFVSALNHSSKSPYYYQEYYMPTFNEKAIEKCVQYIQNHHGKHCCIISFNETSSAVAAVVNDRLGYPYPSILSQIYCSHKLLTRTLVEDFDWYFGFNLGDPEDSIIDKVKTYPCMLKPTMLASGKAAFRCDNPESFRSALQSIRADKTISEGVKQLNAEAVEMLQGNGITVAKQCTQYMVEEFIETNETNTYQFCMEALVTKEGKVIPYALFEEFMFKNGMFLGHIIPPVHLEGSLKACEDYITQIGEKLYRLGFRNQAFNIEFWKFPDGKFRLIEINPRIATPFFQLYEQYSGSYTFDDISSLVLHGKEPAHTPFSKLKKEWSMQRHESRKYVIAADLTTRAIGKATDLFNYQLLDDMLKEGTPLFYLTPRDTTLTQTNRTRLGTTMAYVILQGSWNDIVRAERDLRKRFYKDLSHCEESRAYPNYFIEM